MVNKWNFYVETKENFDEKRIEREFFRTFAQLLYI